LAIPRDRHGTFAPVLIPTHQRRFTGFDDKILALYARGLTVRDIQAFLQEMYAVDVSPDLISTVTDAVQEEVTAWQTRPLEPMYPVVFFDALRVKIRDEAVVQNKAVYLALAIRPDGSRDILGIWIEQTEGAKFWMKVFADLQTRGCRDILIAVTDGLAGMGEALEAVYPRTTWQTCVVHLLRRRPPPTVMTAWRRARPHVIPFFAFPPDIRRTIYTTNALENVNRQIRKATKTRGHFPTDEAAIKLIWLAIRHLTARWSRGEHHWKAAMNQFAILYGDRFEHPASHTKKLTAPERTRGGGHAPPSIPQSAIRSHHQQSAISHPDPHSSILHPQFHRTPGASMPPGSSVALIARICLMPSSP